MAPLVLLVFVAHTVAETANVAGAATPALVVEAQGAEQGAEARAEALLQKLRALREAVACDELIAAAAAVRVAAQAASGGDPPLSAVHRHELQFMQGECLVLVGNIREANDLFRAVFLEDAAAKVTLDDVEPRVNMLIEAARAEVLKQRDAEKDAVRAALIERIRLDVTATDVKGGARAIFFVSLKDPDGVVKSMRLDFRKEGDPEFYALPVTRKSDGSWRGEIPGTYTKTATGAQLDWYVTASDELGEKLKSFGERAQPKRLTISPGSVIARDLRANERLPAGFRFASAIAFAPLSTAGGAAAGLLIGVSPVALILFGVNEALALSVAGILVVTLPTLGTMLGASIVNNELLDGDDALLATLIPTAIATLGTGCGFVALGLLAAQQNENAVAFALADAAFIVMAVVAPIIVTPTLVALDPPEE